MERSLDELATTPSIAAALLSGSSKTLLGNDCVWSLAGFIHISPSCCTALHLPKSSVKHCKCGCINSTVRDSGFPLWWLKSPSCQSSVNWYSYCRVPWISWWQKKRKEIQFFSNKWFKVTVTHALSAAKISAVSVQPNCFCIFLRLIYESELGSPVSANTFLWFKCCSLLSLKWTLKMNLAVRMTSCRIMWAKSSADILLNSFPLRTAV